MRVLVWRSRRVKLEARPWRCLPLRSATRTLSCPSSATCVLQYKGLLPAFPPIKTNCTQYTNSATIQLYGSSASRHFYTCGARYSLWPSVCFTPTAEQTMPCCSLSLAISSAANDDFIPRLLSSGPSHPYAWPRKLCR